MLDARALEALKSLTPRSPAFAAGGPIPPRHTCEGDDVAPAIEFGPRPVGTCAVALLVDDPDAPRGAFTHWVAWNLPADLDALPEGADVTALGGLEGRNDFADVGYRGPCPPSGTHRYFFKVYALDALLDLPRGARRSTFEDAIAGHVLAWGETMGTSTR
ncbi:MAG TPA: YbhB/YbcL family Raf kinase inhibitor-like protein [Candidatus Thermoplasmatota archaeon]|nr:YbhB/YbcL family Raf kinase inhibitor-like protein [Candidatus Thermoplasmatota archaeon]